MNSTTIFRDYGQEALDAQYNNRARVPEHQDIHAGYQARAAAVVEEFETRLDVSPIITRPQEPQSTCIASPGS